MPFAVAALTVVLFATNIDPLWSRPVGLAFSLTWLAGGLSIALAMTQRVPRWLAGVQIALTVVLIGLLAASALSAPQILGDLLTLAVPLLLGLVMMVAARWWRARLRAQDPAANTP